MANKAQRVQLVYIKGAREKCVPPIRVVYCGTLGCGVLHTVASEAQRAQLVLKEPNKCLEKFVAASNQMVPGLNCVSIGQDSGDILLG